MNFLTLLSTIVGRPLAEHSHLNTRISRVLNEHPHHHTEENVEWAAFGEQYIEALPLKIFGRELLGGQQFVPELQTWTIIWPDMIDRIERYDRNTIVVDHPALGSALVDVLW